MTGRARPLVTRGEQAPCVGEYNRATRCQDGRGSGSKSTATSGRCVDHRRCVRERVLTVWGTVSRGGRRRRRHARPRVRGAAWQWREEEDARALASGVLRVYLNLSRGKLFRFGPGSTYLQTQFSLMWTLSKRVPLRPLAGLSVSLPRSASHTHTPPSHSTPAPKPFPRRPPLTPGQPSLRLSARWCRA